MEPYKIQIIESTIVLFIYAISRFTLRYFVKLKILNSYFKNTEKRDVLKLINLILLAVLVVILLVVWSAKQENVLVIASSLLTVLGVALFAEMSILSNITACLILFFQHPIKVGDTISVTHEGKDIEGELIDITYFFVFIKTQNRGTLTIPNALLLKSSFLIIEKASKTEKSV
jgi:small-conductance mechanosensitive channel